MEKKEENEKNEEKKIREQLRLINHLATRLPWIAVIVVVFATIVILMEAYFKT